MLFAKPIPRIPPRQSTYFGMQSARRNSVKVMKVIFSSLLGKKSALTRCIVRGYTNGSAPVESLNFAYARQPCDICEPRPCFAQRIRCREVRMLSIDTHASCATCGRYRGCTNVVGDVWAFYYCPQCANCMQHLCIADAALLASVSRLTVYWWVSRGLVHWTTLPCEHRVICLESLIAPAQMAASDAHVLEDSPALLMPPPPFWEIHFPATYDLIGMGEPEDLSTGESCVKARTAACGYRQNLTPNS